jgi:hypothetical protein
MLKDARNKVTSDDDGVLNVYDVSRPENLLRTGRYFDNGFELPGAAIERSALTSVGSSLRANERNDGIGLLRGN